MEQELEKAVSTDGARGQINQTELLDVLLTMATRLESLDKRVEQLTSLNKIVVMTMCQARKNRIETRFRDDY